MSNTNDGGPAFPVSTRCEDGKWGHQDGPMTWQCPGMTLRDYFAAAALAGLFVNDENPTCTGTTDKEIENERLEYAAEFARAAYRYADAMLKARGGAE